MHILIAAIGRLKSGPESALYEHYIKRLQWKVTLKEREIKKQLTSEKRKAQEAELLLEAAENADHVIALDERGKDFTSAAFAAYLQRCRDHGEHTVAFLIGGADGLDDSVKKRANLLLSFGRITWPHMLMRGLLAEQIYRAHTILHNHPYHRE